jgi:hypothetical protein|tara:strand:+ start:49 stop:276 length:228 start_codon:yes stop_codon:yes gene_type:complete
MKDKPLFYILKSRRKNTYFCQDGNWREYCLVGEGNDLCVRTYKSLRGATNQAERLGLDEYTILHAYKDTKELNKI